MFRFFNSSMAEVYNIKNTYPMHHMQQKKIRITLTNAQNRTHTRSVLSSTQNNSSRPSPTHS
jgi:hypothetical protein